jgi:hypothetical protein
VVKLSCRACGRPLLLVTFPSDEDIKSAAADETKKPAPCCPTCSNAKGATSSGRASRSALKNLSQHDGDDYVITAGSQLVWRERARTEDGERFNEVKRLLRRKYKGRLASLTPTEAAAKNLLGGKTPSRRSNLPHTARRSRLRGVLCQGVAAMSGSWQATTSNRAAFRLAPVVLKPQSSTHADFRALFRAPKLPCRGIRVVRPRAGRVRTIVFVRVNGAEPRLPGLSGRDLRTPSRGDGLSGSGRGVRRLRGWLVHPSLRATAPARAVGGAAGAASA